MPFRQGENGQMSRICSEERKIHLSASSENNNTSKKKKRQLEIHYSLDSSWVHSQERNEILSEVSCGWRAKKLDTDIRAPDSACATPNSWLVVKQFKLVTWSWASKNKLIFSLLHRLGLRIVDRLMHSLDVFSFEQSYHCYNKKYKGPYLIMLIASLLFSK